MNVWDRPPGIREACAPSGGANGQDARSTNADSVKDCRLTATERPTFRVRSAVGVTGGYVEGADPNRKARRKTGGPKAKKWTPKKTDPVYGVWAR